MEVHLVAVKVCVVGSCDAEVEAEGGEGHDASAVPHHGHLVEGGLAVEDDDVACHEVALDDGAAGLYLSPEVPACLEAVLCLGAIEADDCDALCAGVLVGAGLDEALELADVERVDVLGDGECNGDGDRHAHLVDVEVGVRRDNSAPAEVHALSHEVSAHPPLLALQALRDGLVRAPRR